MGGYQMTCLQKLLSPFQGPNRFAALLPPSDKPFQYHNEYCMPRSFVREHFLSNFANYLCGSRNSGFDYSVYIANRISLESFFNGCLDLQEICLPNFHYFAPGTLKMSRTTFHNEVLELEDTHWSCAILILPVTLAPLAGLHASKRRDNLACFAPFQPLPASSSLAQCSRS